MKQKSAFEAANADHCFVLEKVSIVLFPGTNNLLSEWELVAYFIEILSRVAETRQIVLLTSSAINNDPSFWTSSPTGLP